MKAARRRSSLLPSPEKNSTRLALVEEAQRARQPRTFVFMPRTDSPPAKFSEGEGPQRGDVLIFFPAISDTDETLESFLARERPKAASAPVLRELPWKHADREPPVKRPDPDAELEALAAEPESDIRPLNPGEMREAMSGLAATGNLLRRHVVRNALTGGQVPLGDDEEFPKAEFASSTTGTLLIRIWRYPGEQAKPRPATETDRQTWPATFEKFIAACWARRNQDEEDKK